MAQFKPVDYEMIFPKPRFVFDPERNRRVRKYLGVLCGASQRCPYTWGYAIFRTVYTPGSDEAFKKAIDRLGIYAKSFVDEDLHHKRLPNEGPPDPSPNRELWSRYYNEIVEDPETLNNVGVEEVGRIFEAWVEEQLSPFPRHPPDCRFYLCLMLDQESINNILAMPEDPDTDSRVDPQCKERWVNVVSTGEMVNGERLCFRAGIKEFLWSQWFDALDPDIMDVDFEDYGWFSDDGVLNFRDKDGVANWKMAPAHADMVRR